MKIIKQLGFYCILIVGITYAGLKPDYNWDMIAYMGSVLKNTPPYSDNFHKSTYEILKNELDNENYNRLTSGSYRSTLKNDKQAFHENLPYYTIRIIYIGFISVLFKIGIPLTFATILPSLLSVFLIIIIIFKVLDKELKNTLIAGLIALILLFLPQTLHLARLSTPDALSSLLLLVTAILYLYKYNWFYILIFMSLAIMTRTDNILWCIPLLFLELLFVPNKKSSKFVAVIIVLLSLIFFLINATHSNGGWAILFYNSFIERQTFPLSLTPSLSLKYYLLTIIKMTPNYMPWFLLIILACYKFKKLNVKDFLMIRGGKVIVTSVMFLLIKFVLFPLFDSRFYLILLLILLITLAIEWKTFLLLKTIKTCQKPRL